MPGAWSWWPAPAKLNLCLRIIGRRADGYHDLQSAFRLLDWGDRVGIRVRADGVISRVGTSVAGVAEADDLLVRAALLLQEHANVAQGADICVEKRIPAGGGFGGVLGDTLGQHPQLAGVADVLLVVGGLGVEVREVGEQQHDEHDQRNKQHDDLRAAA